MAARDEETGEAMSDGQLRDEVMTIFLAGHETTANALTWTLYLLSRHPEVRRRLEREVAEALGGRAPTAADLPKLGYALAVVQESMRLYPPVWLVMRRCERDDVIAGYRVPAHDFIALPPFIIHRDPKLFENPEGFDPDRFLGERAAQIPRFGYLPFSAGPRVCIGNGFALMEAQLVLASLVQRFRLDLVPGHRVELHAAVTLRPRHGMRMTLHSTR
jgi:cytochrome P450